MDHLAIPVRDQARSRRFYETYFGFDARPPRRYEGDVLMLYNAAGFALALGPTDQAITPPVWMHFGIDLLAVMPFWPSTTALCRGRGGVGRAGLVSVKFRDGGTPSGCLDDRTAVRLP